MVLSTELSEEKRLLIALEVTHEGTSLEGTRRVCHFAERSEEKS